MQISPHNREASAWETAHKWGIIARNNWLINNDVNYYCGEFTLFSPLVAQSIEKIAPLNSKITSYIAIENVIRTNGFPFIDKKLSSDHNRCLFRVCWISMDQKTPKKTHNFPKKKKLFSNLLFFVERNYKLWSHGAHAIAFRIIFFFLWWVSES